MTRLNAILRNAPTLEPNERTKMDYTKSSGYAYARLKLACDVIELDIHKLAHLANHAEHPLHAAYLGGVAFGGGYRYAAIGLLVCMAVAWVAKE